MQLKDQAAIVTGGASGLGAATARKLAAAGAKVAVFPFEKKVLPHAWPIRGHHADLKADGLGISSKLKNTFIVLAGARTERGRGAVN